MRRRGITTRNWHGGATRTCIGLKEVMIRKRLKDDAIDKKSFKLTCYEMRTTQSVVIWRLPDLELRTNCCSFHSIYPEFCAVFALLMLHFFRCRPFRKPIERDIISTFIIWAANTTTPLHHRRKVRGHHGQHAVCLHWDRDVTCAVRTISTSPRPKDSSGP